ncbi:unnamed protein product [Discula destructiva]
MPELHLPAGPGVKAPGKASKKASAPVSKKRKRHDEEREPEKVLIDDDGNATVATSEKDLKMRLAALSSFQLKILLHAFAFPAARRITYSTCSIHAEENEQVVMDALGSDLARQRGWQILPRESQVSGMKAWPVRGLIDACDGNSHVAEACIRAHKDDGRGVMGFFVAAFERNPLSSPSLENMDSTSRSGVPKRARKNKVSMDRSSEAISIPKSNGDGDKVEAEGGGDDSEWGGFDD